MQTAMRDVLTRQDEVNLWSNRKNHKLLLFLAEQHKEGGAQVAYLGSGRK